VDASRRRNSKKDGFAGCLRDNNLYTSRNWFNQFGAITKEVVTCADVLERAGYVEIVSGKYFENFKRRSRIRMTERLAQMLRGFDGQPNELYMSVSDEADLIRLKENKSKYVFYEDTEFVIEARRKLEIYNNMMKNHTVGHAGAFCEDISVSRAALHRIFNQDWQSGGRFYGASYQHMRKEDRRGLLLDDSPVVEIDYTATFPTLAYNIQGIDYWSERDKRLPKPMSEPYFFEGYSFLLEDQIEQVRNLQKRMLCIHLMNAKPGVPEGQVIETTRQALQREINQSRAKNDAMFPTSYPYGITLREYLERFLGVDGPHKRLDWSSIDGMFLMFVESEIAAQIMEKFTDLDKPVLIVHDSFLAKEEDKDLLEETMKSAWADAVAKYGKEGSKGFRCEYKVL